MAAANKSAYWLPRCVGLSRRGHAGAVLTRKGMLRLILGLHVLLAAEALILYWVLFPSFERTVLSVAPVLQNVMPAVVTLRVTGTRKISREVLPLAERPDEANDQAPETEVFRTGGSGVVIDPRLGYIITNSHVIENATDIDVGLSDGRHFSAQIVGRDIGSDLALLQIEAAKLPSIHIGDSDSVRVGDLVIAVGNPYGLEGTATLGIVSALMRTEIGHDSFEDYLQIDAQINPGNSGGALVNHRSELIGINTVVAGGRGRGFSIGFAIPINMARMISDEIAKHGRVRRGGTGLVVATLSHVAGAKIEGVSHGAVVLRVVANTPAALQGIKPGDIVLRAANKPVRSAAEFRTRESMIPIGGKIPLVVLSGGSSKNLFLDVADVSLEPTKVVLQDKMGGVAGLVVADILPGNILYGELQGAQVVEVPPLSPSRFAGLEVGDVIVSVDGTKIFTAAELTSRIERAGLEYRLDLMRNQTPHWLRMRRQ
jgi:S1-C subfamily serine protease